MVHNKLVIIPTYKEKENIQQMTEAIMAIPEGFDMLVIDDGSPDGTAEIVKENQQRYPNQLHLIERPGKMGLGTAYIEGFQYALEHGYEYIFEMDCDFSHNPNDLVALYEACHTKGYDLAIGSRYITGVNVVNWPMGRVLMSWFASWYVRLILGIPVMDTTAGFKCYKRRVIASVEPDKIHFIGYAFQIEMKFNTWKKGFKIVEVPIIFTDRTKGTSKMTKGIFKEAVLGVIELKIRSLFRKYKPTHYVAVAE